MLNKTWQIEFISKHTIANPHIYFRTDFYLNYRTIMKSKSFSQLRGDSISESDAREECSSAVYNSDINQTLTGINGNHLDSKSIAYPWGIYSKYMFSDTFKLVNSANNSTVNIIKYWKWK